VHACWATAPPAAGAHAWRPAVLRARAASHHQQRTPAAPAGCARASGAWGRPWRSPPEWRHPSACRVCDARWRATRHPGGGEAVRRRALLTLRTLLRRTRNTATRTASADNHRHTPCSARAHTCAAPVIMFLT
jgi:hypothetical protein